MVEGNIDQGGVSDNIDKKNNTSGNTKIERIEDRSQKREKILEERQEGINKELRELENISGKTINQKKQDNLKKKLEKIKNKMIVEDQKDAQEILKEIDKLDGKIDKKTTYKGKEIDLSNIEEKISDPEISRNSKEKTNKLNNEKKETKIDKETINNRKATTKNNLENRDQNVAKEIKAKEQEVLKRIEEGAKNGGISGALLKFAKWILGNEILGNEK